MNLLCRMGWHNWGNWSKLITNDVLSVSDNSPVGLQYMQFRSCKRCNKSQVSSSVIMAGKGSK